MIVICPCFFFLASAFSVTCWHHMSYCRRWHLLCCHEDHILTKRKVFECWGQMGIQLCFNWSMFVLDTCSSILSYSFIGKAHSGCYYSQINSVSVRGREREGSSKPQWSLFVSHHAIKLNFNISPPTLNVCESQFTCSCRLLLPSLVAPCCELLVPSLFGLSPFLLSFLHSVPWAPRGDRQRMRTLIVTPDRAKPCIFNPLWHYSLPPFSFFPTYSLFLSCYLSLCLTFCIPFSVGIESPSHSLIHTPWRGITPGTTNLSVLPAPGACVLLCVHVWTTDSSAVQLRFRASQLASGRERMGRGDGVCIHWPSAISKRLLLFAFTQTQTFWLLQCRFMKLIALLQSPLVASWRQPFVWVDQWIHQ